MMKRVFVLLLALLPVFVYGQSVKYVVLITIDGLRPEFYLDSSWGMVNLRHLMAEGVAAKGVNPVFPSVTYPDHTTLITGVGPARHGIYFNSPLRPRGESGQSYVYYDSIKVETIFDAMRKAGRTTADIIWPVTVHAPIDFNVPDIAQPGSRDRRGITAANVYPVSLWKTLQDSVVGQLDVADWNMFDDELVMDENIGRMGAWLIKKHKPGLTAVHFAAADHYQHEYGRDGYAVRAAVAGIDRGIKSILEAVRRAGIKDSTVIIVTGDHGFENVYRVFQPNVLLRENGLITDLRRDQWRAQFYQQGGSAFLVLKDPGDREALSRVQGLLGALPDSVKQYFAIIDKERLEKVGAFPGAALAITGLKGTAFGSRSTVRSGGSIQDGGMARGGSLVQDGATTRGGGSVQDGGMVRSGGPLQDGATTRGGSPVQDGGMVRRGSPVQDDGLIDVLPAVKGNHGFFPDHQEIRTGFVAAGAGIRHGVLLSEMNIVDICPLIVHLTGIPFGAVDGRLYPEMFDPGPANNR